MIYFIDEQHQMNYEMLIINKWPNGLSNVEYQTPIYIMAIPMIFKKVEEYLDELESPVDWIWRWEYKYTMSADPEHPASQKEDIPEIPYDLTGSMVQLGKFALNMWNGYKHFNLMKCLDSLDDKHMQVFKCAIDMRLGAYQGRLNNES
ncbi:DUF2538 family protein [Peribacillus frigoritolerans]|uniref:DUF2538 family protein n=1 Tax=Peribacillus frigoritolerans TaxID=450367 RepID=UPI0021CE0CFE|nr:DUF2538 family protein [Peribacillus frigoritolerans]MCU6603802.1 DUF2538 family protein [Peribacillus frigoritolerans]